VLSQQTRKDCRFLLRPRPQEATGEREGRRSWPTGSCSSSALDVVSLEVSDVAPSQASSSQRPALCPFPTDAQVCWRATLLPPSASASPALRSPRERCDHSGRLQFCQDGYLSLQKVVPQEVVDTAKAFINAQLARLINSAAAA
ncbi:unnamed protein product, partial [Polarella glacialis]